MQTVWLVPCILLTLGLVSALALFFSVKRELRIQGRRNDKKIAQMMALLEEAASVPPVLTQAPAETIYVPLSPRSGMDPARRTQALRLLRRGEGIEHISAALGIPQVEVALLIRIQELIQHRIGEPVKSHEAGSEMVH